MKVIIENFKNISPLRKIIAIEGNLILASGKSEKTGKQRLYFLDFESMSFEEIEMFEGDLHFQSQVVFQNETLIVPLFREDQVHIYSVDVRKKSLNWVQQVPEASYKTNGGVWMNRVGENLYVFFGNSDHKYAFVLDVESGEVKKSSGDFKVVYEGKTRAGKLFLRCSDGLFSVDENLKLHQISEQVKHFSLDDEYVYLYQSATWTEPDTYFLLKHDGEVVRKFEGEEELEIKGLFQYPNEGTTIAVTPYGLSKIDFHSGGFLVNRTTFRKGKFSVSGYLNDDRLVVLSLYAISSDEEGAKVFDLKNCKKIGDFGKGNSMLSYLITENFVLRMHYNDSVLAWYKIK